MTDLPPFPRMHSGTIQQLRNNQERRTNAQIALDAALEHAADLVGEALLAEDARAATRDRLSALGRPTQRGNRR